MPPSMPEMHYAATIHCVIQYDSEEQNTNSASRRHSDGSGLEHLLGPQIKTDPSIDSLLGCFGDSLPANERMFAARAWNTELLIYRERLKAIGFVGLPRVLDAGCGYGQWSCALDALNRDVFAVDYSATRIQIASTLARAAGGEDIRFAVQSVDQLAFADNSFDAVFCYSVIYATDPRRTLREFRRVLKPGGRLYICANGIGWQISGLLKGQSGNGGFDHRRAAIRALKNTIRSFFTGHFASGAEHIMSSRTIASELTKLGFANIVRGGEGTIHVDPDCAPSRFFSDTYYGFEGVYEILAESGREELAATNCPRTQRPGILSR